jgi:hypothetical protein
MASHSISLTNQAFINSEINNTCVVNANVRKWVGFSEDPSDISSDMADLISNNQVAQWRIDDLADVVCVITNAGYTSLLGLSGIRPDPNHPDPSDPNHFITNLGDPKEDLAFMIVEGNSLNANYTFSHELGHLIGCRHQTCAQYQVDGCDDFGGFEHGLGWGERKCWLCNWRNHNTIMYMLRDDGGLFTGPWKRILHYSNPNVYHNGHNTGESQRDNARWIRDGHACFVANYNPDPIIPLSAKINGEDILCKPLSGEYFASVNGSNSPFSYEWHISTDGVNWGNSVGNGVSIWVNSNNYPIKSIVFLRVRVQDANGNFVFSFFNIKIFNSGSPACNLQLLSGGTNNSQVVHAYPNPVSGEITLEFDIKNENTKGEFSISGLDGQKLISTSKIYPKGHQTEIFNLNSITNNILFLRAVIDEKAQVTKIIKIH